MMSKPQFDMLVEKLDILIKLTAMNVLRDKNKTEQIGFLTSLGFQPKEIALIVGTTKGTVRSLRRRLKARTKKESDETPQAKDREKREAIE
jgi:hypothetical protein